MSTLINLEELENLETIEEVIEEIKEDRKVSEIKSYLNILGYKAKEINDALLVADISKAKSTFNPSFYTYLSEGKRSKAEVKAYILGEGEYGETTDNVVKHLSFYSSIGDLSRRIFESFEESNVIPTEEVSDEV